MDEQANEDGCALVTGLPEIGTHLESSAVEHGCRDG